MVAIRKSLPNRRASESFGFVCAGLNYTATVSRDDEGHLAELFVNNHKVNSEADINARDAAILCSLLLQYGAPVKMIRASLGCNSDGEPISPVGVALKKVEQCDTLGSGAAR